MSIRGLHLIAGEWRAGSGERLTSRDPANGEEVWRGRAADAEAVDAACAAARRTFPEWEALPIETRAENLREFARVLEKRAGELTEIISREAGKPLWESRAEVRSMIAKVEISIEAHAARCGEFRGGAAVTRFRPHGVVAVFGPFNFPGHLPNGHIVPALLAGNTVVFKPSERTPAVAELTGAIWLEAGLPAGVLGIVQGAHATGEALANDPRVDGIFFTGSARGGLWLHRLLAGRPDKILALEMGGNNPLVAWRIQNLDAAVAAAAQSAWLTAGQRCTCARRLIVPAADEGDAFLEKLAQVATRLRVGAWNDDPEPFMGPMIGADAARALVRAQAALIARGAVALVPLRNLREGTGRVSPGLIDVTAVKNREDEELFGPLLQVVRTQNFDTALAEARATRFGLAAGLLSDDPELWERFRRGARAGIVNWNQPLTGASSATPFGGIGLSGNHRPGAWLAADYCSHPVAGIEVASLALPEKLPPGFPRLGTDETEPRSRI
ncbi:MAG: succinylglutamate-semialdehyde dehydrogenase [Opitutaceae bacterium]